jgi:hypothetical protein
MPGDTHTHAANTAAGTSAVAGRTIADTIPAVSRDRLELAESRRDRVYRCRLW